MDTGSAYSILPFSSTSPPTGPALIAASGASIKAWGRRRVQLSVGGKIFSWKFLQADVAFPIIGADFLDNFKMAVDFSSRQLLCPAGLKIPLEAPRAGSLAAAAIGVVEATSSPPLHTVEAPASTPSLPTVEALGERSPVVAAAAAKKEDSVALEVEQLMADFPIVVHSSKKLPVQAPGEAHH